jgi:hypothetical protein
MLHGSSLMTRDLDIVCPMEAATMVLLHDALAPFHPVHRLKPERPSFTRQQAEEADLRNLCLGTDLGVLDCLGEVRGIGDYDACRARSVEMNLGRVTTHVLDLEAMIEAKRAMGRPRDLLTADELEIIRDRKSS